MKRAISALLLALAGTVLPVSADQSRAAENVIVAENAQPGSTGWIAGSLIADDVTGQIKGYAGATSVRQGGTITLFVTVHPAQTYSMDVYRLGWYAGRGGRQRLHLALDGAPQPPCPSDPVTGLIACDWAPSYQLTIPDDWTSGVYLALLTNAAGYQNYVMFVVRDDRPAPFLYQQSIATDEAYNNYPADGQTGKSLYQHNSYGAITVGGDTRAVKVSFDRPHTGYGFNQWDAINFIRWIERSGYDVTYSTDLDTHENGAELLRHRALLSVGHDEYWSKEMFDAAEAARDGGVSLAFFSSDALSWQVRFEPSSAGVPDRVMVCYREPSIDPVFGPTTTTLWRRAPVNRPGQPLRGVDFSSFVDPGNNVPYVVTNSSHWVYTGTGFHDGDVVPGIVGYEMDRYIPELPAPNTTDWTLLSRSPYTDLHGRSDYSNASIYQAPSGAWVFSSGTESWSWALDGFARNLSDTRIQTVTSNLLNAFLVGPPAPTATHLGITAPQRATTGASFTMSVRAEDAQGNAVSGYHGTVHFSSSDTTAQLPTDSTLTAGEGSFTVTLGQVGPQTITVSDAASSLSTTVAIAIDPDAASRLVLTTAAAPVAGAPFSFTVTAEDRFGNTASAYTGQVHFTSSDTATGLALPADTTLDAGRGTFSATLIHAGAQTITATDTASATITGALTVHVQAVSASRFVLAGGETATAGSAFTFTVTAQDEFGNTDTAYAGQVHFTSSDTATGVALPADASLAAGRGSFSATLIRAGAQTITVTDTANATIVGSLTVDLNSASASRFVLSGGGTATAGTPVTFTVTAQDEFGNTATVYAGRVRFTTSDTTTGVALPAESALGSGRGTFSATLLRAGAQTITATDTLSASLSGTITVSIRAASAGVFAVAGPSTVTAGSAFSFTVTAQDHFGNTDPAYAGRVHFTSSDSASGVALPADATVGGGRGTFSATLIRAGAQTVTVTDTANASISGTMTVSVRAASASRFSVTGRTTATAGAAFSFTVTALDRFGNPDLAYAGRVHFASSDVAAGTSLPADSPLSGGQGAFSATLVRAGNQAITVTDVAAPGIAGTLSVAVSAATASSIILDVPASATTGQVFSFRVTLKDRFGNVATGYRGSVHFRTSDPLPLAVVPGDYTFTATDAGTRLFSATLITPPSQTLTATDIANPGLTATSRPIAVGLLPPLL